MIKAYTISGLKSLHSLPELDIVQFTLNSRTWPGRRQTVKALQEVNKCCSPSIYIHWDFIYIASRFAMFTLSTQNAILQEISDIMDYASSNPNIKGIVMHTDFALRKEVVKNPESLCKIYNSNLWNLDNIKELINHLDAFTDENIRRFYTAFKEFRGRKGFPIKIFLENTTKISYNGQGRLSHLVDMVDKNQWNDLFGICFDCEHYYAIDGEYKLWETLDDLTDRKISSMVHLNVIPEGVTPGSGKDRHSSNTIFECSLKPANWYISMIRELEMRKVSFIREVHEDTMYRELEQINQYNERVS